MHIRALQSFDDVKFNGLSLFSCCFVVVVVVVFSFLGGGAGGGSVFGVQMFSVMFLQQFIKAVLQSIVNKLKVSVRLKLLPKYVIMSTTTQSYTSKVTIYCILQPQQTVILANHKQEKIYFVTKYIT